MAAIKAGRAMTIDQLGLNQRGHMKSPKWP